MRGCADSGVNIRMLTSPQMSTTTLSGHCTPPPLGDTMGMGMPPSAGSESAMGEGRRMLGQLPPIAHGCKLAPTATWSSLLGGGRGDAAQGGGP
jgi:hypothetical protein